MKEKSSIQKNSEKVKKSRRKMVRKHRIDKFKYNSNYDKM